MEIPELAAFIAYLEATPVDTWCVVVYRRAPTREHPTGQNCVFGHILEFVGSPGWDAFEERYATTFMLTPINDGLDPDYPQATPKARVIAYLSNMLIGLEPTTYQCMDMEDARDAARQAAPTD